MPIEKSQAIVLKRRDFRETSLIVEFYTRDFGKLSGLLKGIRADPAKFASILEPFSYNEIIFYRKSSSSLHLISQCDSRDNFCSLRQDIAKTAIASLMMELLAALTAAEDSNASVFELALECLKELENSGNPDKIAAIFKIKMLSLSGFKPQLDACVCCGDKILGQSKFSLALGGLLCGRCCHKDTASRQIFRGTIASILHIERNDLRNNLNLGLNPQIKKELNLILNAFLNFHLEKELKSQRVINYLDDSYAGINEE